MKKREKRYLKALYNDFDSALNKLMDTDKVDWDNKEEVLDNMKFMIDLRLEEMHLADSCE